MSSSSDDAFLAGLFEPGREPKRASAARREAPTVEASPGATRSGGAVDAPMASRESPIPADPSDRRRGGAPLPIAAVVAALWAALFSSAPVVLLVVAGTAGSATGVVDSLRLAGAAWLLGHGVPIETPADRLTLVPLAVTVLVVWRLVRAGVHASRAIGAHRSRTPLRALAAGLAVAAVHAGLGGVTALLVSTPGVRVPALSAAVAFGAVAGLAACLGAVGHSRGGRRMIRRIPAPAGDGLRAGVTAAALILAAGAAAAGVSLALHGGDASAVLHGFQAGVVGQAGITLACLAYAPNAAIWATSYLIGPGFSLGVGTTVSSGMVVVGPVPALPLLPAVPTEPVGAAGPALLAAPLIAALVAGWLLGRRRHQRWSGALGAATLAAPVAGVLLAAAAWASGGALGSGHLAELGPPVLAVGLWGAALSGCGLLLGAVTARALIRR